MSFAKQNVINREINIFVFQQIVSKQGHARESYAPSTCLPSKNSGSLYHYWNQRNQTTNPSGIQVKGRLRIIA